MTNPPGRLAPSSHTPLATTIPRVEHYRPFPCPPTSMSASAQVLPCPSTPMKPRPGWLLLLLALLVLCTPTSGAYLDMRLPRRDPCTNALQTADPQLLSNCGFRSLLLLNLSDSQTLGQVISSSCSSNSCPPVLLGSLQSISSACTLQNSFDVASLLSILPTSTNSSVCALNNSTGAPCIQEILSDLQGIPGSPLAFSQVCTPCIAANQAFISSPFFGSNGTRLSSAYEVNCVGQTSIGGPNFGGQIANLSAGCQSAFETGLRSLSQSCSFSGGAQPFFGSNFTYFLDAVCSNPACSVSYASLIANTSQFCEASFTNIFTLGSIVYAPLYLSPSTNPLCAPSQPSENDFTYCGIEVIQAELNSPNITVSCS
ncbi:uncharacterized protein BJ171DRAFT_565902, partial [Polychytrium aggregatum]|uniref:uncharacterized protein n=1 Tax=Polychytrium aggregatum TaxID=110093 RepID=UPI0022FEE7C3